MKEQFNNMDEMLRRSLSDFQAAPNAGVWRRISLSLTLAGWKYLLLFLVFLLLLIPGYFVFFTGDEIEGRDNMDAHILERENNQNFASDHNHKSESNPESLDLDSGNFVEAIENEKQDIQDKNSNEVVQKGDERVLKASTSDKNSNLVLTNDKNKFDPQFKDHFDIYPGLKRISYLNENLANDSVAYALNAFIFNPSLQNFISPRYGIYPLTDIDYVTEYDLYFGVQAGPEWVFTNDPIRSVKMAINIDASLIYKWNDQFIQGGVGMALSEDDGLFEANYNQYDSVGFYYQVNGFSINPETGQPVYKTTVENVFDTVAYTESAQLNNSYTYLRIPVYYGIDAYQFKRFSLSLKTGLIYAVMIDKNEQDWSYQNDNALGVQIINNTRQRIRSNVQVSVALGLDYLISNRLSLSLEPVANYYVRPIYTNRYQTGSTYSIGAKAGIIIKF